MRQLHLIPDGCLHLVRIFTFDIDLHIVILYVVVFHTIPHMGVHPRIADNQYNPAGRACHIHGLHPCLGKHFHFQPLRRFYPPDHLSRTERSNIALLSVQLPVLPVFPGSIRHNDGLIQSFFHGYPHIPAIAGISLLSQGTNHQSRQL